MAIGHGGIGDLVNEPMDLERARQNWKSTATRSCVSGRYTKQDDTMQFVIIDRSSSNTRSAR